MCLLLSLTVTAQQPETVYGFAKEQREAGWYLTQLQLWKAETVKDPKNGNAWYNYYRAARALRNLSYDDEAKLAEYRKLCPAIVDEAMKAAPDSFEANAIKWLEGGNTLELFPYLKKAYEINPNDPRIYEDLATYYETTRNRKEFEHACQLMASANTMHPGMVNWAYNMLAETEPNAVIFTAGDNDTYGAWVAQEGKHFRQDVKVINLSLIMIDDYRNQLLKELKIPPLDLKISDFSDTAYAASREKILNHFFANSATRPAYVAVSAIHSLGDQWSEQLYLTGLTYRYSKESFDNTPVIQRNYEHRYLLDHLQMTFFSTIGDSMADHLNGCYLPSMLKLYAYYRSSEQTAKAEELKELMISVSRKAGQENEVEAILGSGASTGSGRR